MEFFSEWLPARVDLTPQGCWAWNQARTPEGYGRAWWAGKNWKAHRLVLFMQGVDLTGMEVDHLCKRPYCVNPGHLEAVHPAVNQARKTRSKRRGIDSVVEVVAGDNWGREIVAQALYDLAEHYLHGVLTTGRPAMIHLTGESDVERIIMHCPARTSRASAASDLVYYLMGYKTNHYATKLLGSLKGALR